MQITINRDGQNYGPYTVEQLQQMLQAGRAQLTDLANYEGAAEWVPLSQIPGVTQAQSTPVTAPIDADTYVPTGQHEHEFRIECKPDFSFLTVQVPASQTLKVEASAMATMSSNMVMKTKMKGGLSRFLGGENIFINEFTAQAGPAEIGIAPGSPGDMDHVFMDGSSEIFLQSSAYVASSMNVEVDSKWQGFKGFFSGEGLFLLRCTGQGDLWFNTYGAMIEVPVDGNYVVDTSHVVAFTSGLEYNVESVGGLKSLFLSGEGLVCRFHGQGKVWIQTRHPMAFANWAYPFRPQQNN
ncbi:MAG: TIGR00266 family protein [Limisphaerales bacterium]